jgi:uncharacterized protein (TIGR03067 family)
MKAISLGLLIGLLAVVPLRTRAVQPRPSAPLQELKTLQGTWNLVETDSQGQSLRPQVFTQWIIAGDKLYLRRGKQLVLQGFIQVGLSAKLKTIDLVSNGQPVVLGIFRFRDHRLEVCAGAQRPSVFVAENGNVLSLLEKAKIPRLARRGVRG